MREFTGTGRASALISTIRAKTVFLVAALMLHSVVCHGATTCAQTVNTPARWLTPAERTDYRETPTLDETLAYIDRLARRSPLIRRTSFGRSGENRPLPLVVAASGGEFDATRAQASGKAIVLVQACIHAGEADGKDAGLALLRDIAVTGTRANLLDQVVLLFIPVYNTDGHERRSPYNRINQNGPATMGWRTNGARLNLNRDYMKADAPETRAWLRLWNAWQPDLFVDLHTTDGADFRYDVTYQYEAGANVEPGIAAWMRDSIDARVRVATENRGHLLAPYITFRDNRDPAQGVDAFIASPRFATSYAAVVRNRPALLVETHALKDNRVRVRAAYDILLSMLEDANREHASLRRIARAADNAPFGVEGSLALSLELTGKSTPFNLKGVEIRRETSDISGVERVVFLKTPRDYVVPFYVDSRVAMAVRPPRYYIVPPAWTDIIERLDLHGVRYTRTPMPLTIEAEVYRFRDVKLASASFENRVRVSYNVEPVRLMRTFPANSVIVSLAQPAARAAVHLLEPAAPDSLASWGFFNWIFEQKEFGEDYIMEDVARGMLERDARLRDEFASRLRADSRFAADPAARLRFFYERSPYADADLNIYPVARVDAELPPNVVRRVAVRRINRRGVR